MKTVYNIIKDDEVAGTSTDIAVSPAIPAGKRVRIRRFGGYDRPVGDGIGSLIALQWGSGGSFDTVRAFGNGSFEVSMDQDFEGDGSKLFRIVRINKSATSKEMVAWLDALVL